MLVLNTPLASTISSESRHGSWWSTDLCDARDACDACDACDGCVGCDACDASMS